MMAQPNPPVFSQEQLEVSFQILLFPQILDRDTDIENTTAFL